ncbi:MAG: SNF2-related protein, partial [Bacteroidota bacterium]
MMKKLLPFQKEGVRYALERGGRCLIADEMGLGKTLQAITTM